MSAPAPAPAVRPLRRVEGIVAPLDRADVDTDQIIPKQFLKRVERAGYGQFLFNDWRFHPDGSPRSDFVLNQPGYAGAAILAAGRNFGCGSSREHAAWSIADYGFRVVMAPSFADIFQSNCHQNGILPLALPEEEVAGVLARAADRPGYALTVDLEACTVGDAAGWRLGFAIDDFRRRCLLEGLDDIGLTLTLEAEITRFEQRAAGNLAGWDR